ncbi:endolytic transglycosylase MltG [Bifidobacterium vespertilionis]|uniref:endolytic transglycosylase MltG n=1 Tax=Bifidobacterium vespertilionis TaxID=2562524 RepID=UPI001BDC79F9|nr:endolytic transglycosylase MltG [Bifidobacterium vespertilionis]
MAEDFHDFFAENSQWVDQNGQPAPQPTDQQQSTGTVPPPPAPPKSRKDMRRRRRRAKRSGLTKILLVVAALALVAVCIWTTISLVKSGKGLFSTQDTSSSVVNDYAGPGEGSVEFTVSEGESATEIAQKLVEADIVKTAGAFTQAVANAGAPSLYPGTFQLQTKMKASDVVTILSDNTKAGGYLQVKAGERVSDVIANAASLSGIAEADFKAVIDAGGDGILPAEANGKFEGWFEPGSYNVKGQTSAKDVLKTMVDKRVAKLDSLGVPTGAERERLLIIASIAEAEVNRAEYYGKVSRVILNRLDKGMTLGMDTTVAYGLGIKASQLTNAQLNDASNPYNTRLIKGLTPTPISNPGDNAIQAAMNPESGDWLFFVTTNLSTGETKFTTGSEADQKAQFEQYVQEYKTTNPGAN